MNSNNLLILGLGGAALYFLSQKKQASTFSPTPSLASTIGSIISPPASVKPVTAQGKTAKQNNTAAASGVKVSSDGSGFGVSGGGIALNINLAKLFGLGSNKSTDKSTPDQSGLSPDFNPDYSFGTDVPAKDTRDAMPPEAPSKGDYSTAPVYDQPPAPPEANANDFYDYSTPGLGQDSLGFG